MASRDHPKPLNQLSSSSVHTIPSKPTLSDWFHSGSFADTSKGGIELDEACRNVSSLAIPSKASRSSHSQGNPHGKLSADEVVNPSGPCHSLPSSPRKSLNRKSLEDIRAELYKLKEEDVLGIMDVSCEAPQMPRTTLSKMISGSMGDKASSAKTAAHEGESSRHAGYSVQIQTPSPPLLNTHDISNGPSAHQITINQPVQGHLPCEYNTFPLPAKTTSNPLGNNHDIPPSNFQKQNLAPAFPNSGVDFPPLEGSSSYPNQTFSNQVPSGQDKTPWNYLFKANRLKANGISLDYIPCTPGSSTTSHTITISAEEVEDELTRWQHALVGYVIGANTPYKLMKQFIDLYTTMAESPSPF